MPDYKHHMHNQFSACRLLANAYDPYRRREVRLFHIPGDFTTVGVCDGTDAWIAPAAANPFSVDVLKLYQRIQAGEIIETPGMVRKRVVVKPPHSAVQPSTVPAKAFQAQPDQQAANTTTIVRKRVHVTPLHR